MTDLREAFDENQRTLWAMCYRMTGSAADADDVVQDTFVRAMERPPADTSRAWRPWLVRVAMNLSRDALRLRQAREYSGPWLPTPIPTDRDGPAGLEPTVDGRVSTAARYEMMESVSFAFLLALEQLTPAQRAVLLLRDVFDYSVRETAEALELTESNVKTTHHRARALLASYDGERVLPSPELSAATGEVIAKMLAALASEDHEALLSLLDEEIVAYSDGGGVYFAARKPVAGRDKVLRFYLNIVAERGMPERVEPIELNGLTGLLLEWDETPEGQPPRGVILYQLGATGRVARSYTVLAPDKLHAVRRL